MVPSFREFIMLLMRQCLLPFLALLLPRPALAQESIPQIPVNVADLDPLATCNRRGGQFAVWNKKAYYFGGVSTFRNGTSYPFEALNHYLRIFDFTTSRDLNTSNISAAENLPSFVPVTADSPCFFAVNDKLYLAGGTIDSDYLTQDGQWLPTNWTHDDVLGSNVYHYDVGEKNWIREAAVQPSNGPAVVDSFSQGSPAWNSPAKTGYYWKGSNFAGVVQDYPGAPWTFVSVDGNQITPQGLMIFNPSSMTWARNDTAPGPETERGCFVSLPGLESDTGGVLVGLGGKLGSSGLATSLRQVAIYDTKTRRWFNQTATAENDDFPLPRQLFCAVAISAPDDSSHNIYIYGGQADEADEALDDVWILSIPSFRWIPVGSTSVPRLGPACALLEERYMLTYGGVTHLSDVANGTVAYEPCDTAQSGLRLYDLTMFAWTGQYEVAPGNYTAAVPSKIFNVIGGGPSGAATMTAPGGGFDDSVLSTVFAVAAASASSATKSTLASITATAFSTAGISSGGSSHTGAIVGGVVGGVLGPSLLVGVVVYIQRRKREAATPPTVPELSDMAKKERPELLGQPRHEMNGDYAHEILSSDGKGAGVHELHGDHAYLQR
ncbi:hypothetical protein H2200_012612 [Cladophialophora chaetospira]|uniref:Kelch repeat protein n=1 Tax=Cladophialophora chaetospira TaxID=386627 RepID=A0AA38WXB7_9EURO|nr:hypothetical protein H2200_012612 [Cladophialophora chaetospira]